MRELKLTIGIPTYNRPAQLVENVRRILPQLNDQCELMIIDNCSPYEMSSLFNKDELDKIKILKNKLNLGPDANIAAVVYNCETEWIWTLGDDDYVTPNAIETILNYINIHSDAIYFNFNTVIDRVVNNFNDFVEIFKYRMAFANSFWISGCVFNRYKLNNDIKFFYVYQTCRFGQLVMVLKHLEENDDKCVFTTEKIIEKQAVLLEETGKFTWSTLDFVIQSSIIYYIFRDKKKLLSGTMFKALTSENFTFVYNEKIPFTKKLYYYNKLVANVGIVDFVRYNYITILHRFLKTLVPKKIYHLIVKKVSRFGVKNW